MECVSESLRTMADVIQGKYVHEKGRGKPGDKDYKPPLAYWITPGGKKMLVDQKSAAESFSDKLWTKNKMEIEKMLDFFKNQAKELDNKVRDSKIWKLLDEWAQKSSEKEVEEELAANGSWKNFIEGNYASMEDWMADIKKLEDWVKNQIEKLPC